MQMQFIRVTYTVDKIHAPLPSTLFSVNSAGEWNLKATKHTFYVIYLPATGFLPATTGYGFPMFFRVSTLCIENKSSLFSVQLET